jgi:bifunctional non-homologous end joining protein LigD
VLRAAELAGLEGIVAKRLAAPYRSGKRSADWTKVPLIKTQEVVIIGWKPGEGRRAGMIGSLLLAVSGERDELTFAGNVGTGFTDSALRMLQQQLAPLARATPAMSEVPREHARYANWVEPILVGEVEHRNWTPDGRLRHPSWRGLRADRTPPVRRAPEPVPYPSQGEVVAKR